MESSAPTTSSRGARGSRDSGTKRYARIKRHDHDRDVDRGRPSPTSSAPTAARPTRGPSPTPTAATPAQIPIARARSRGIVKTFVMIDRVAGMMNAAPTAITTRVAIRIDGDDGERRHERSLRRRRRAPASTHAGTDRTDRPGCPRSTAIPRTPPRTSRRSTGARSPTPRAAPSARRARERRQRHIEDRVVDRR